VGNRRLRSGDVRHLNRIRRTACSRGFSSGFRAFLDAPGTCLVPSLPYALSFWRSVFPACNARKPLL
jgi:hypothetical protein